MARRPEPSPYERRLEDLRREEEALRRQLRSASRAARKTDATPAAAPRDPRPLPPSPPAPRVRARPGFLTEPPAPEKAAVPEAAAGTETAADTRARPELPAEPRKVANFLSSGSFGSSRPVAEERRYQRNKAIFMVIFAAILAVVVYAVIR